MVNLSLYVFFFEFFYVVGEKWATTTINKNLHLHAFLCLQDKCICNLFSDNVVFENIGFYFNCTLSMTDILECILKISESRYRIFSTK